MQSGNRTDTPNTRPYVFYRLQFGRRRCIYKSKKSTINLPEPLKSFVNTFPRQALHAYSLGFEHPINHQRLSFTADFPEDMQNLIENLRVFN